MVVPLAQMLVPLEPPSFQNPPVVVEGSYAKKPQNLGQNVT